MCKYTKAANVSVGQSSYILIKEAKLHNHIISIIMFIYHAIIMSLELTVVPGRQLVTQP